MTNANFFYAQTAMTGEKGFNRLQGYDSLVKPDELVTIKFGISILNLEICPHKQVCTN